MHSELLEKGARPSLTYSFVQPLQYVSNLMLTENGLINFKTESWLDFTKN